MAWIESHQGVERHPKTMKLSLLMGWDIDQTIGKLHRLWWWCLDFAPDGNVRRHSADMVAMAVGLSADMGERFISAMYEAEFLDKTTKDQYLIHDWMEYAGRYLKDTKFRRNPEKIQEIIHLYSTIVRRQSADNPPKKLRKSAVPTLPNLPDIPTLPSGDRFDDSFWKKYPLRNGKKIGKESCRKMYDALSDQDRDNVDVAVIHYAKSDQAVRGFSVDPIRFFKSKEYPNGLWREWIEPEVKDGRSQNGGRGGARSFTDQREDAQTEQLRKLFPKRFGGTGDIQAPGDKRPATDEIRDPGMEIRPDEILAKNASAGD